MPNEIGFVLSGLSINNLSAVYFYIENFSFPVTSSMLSAWVED